MSLSDRFSSREKEQLFFHLIAHYANVSRLIYLTNPGSIIDSESEKLLVNAIDRLNDNVPVQYITNKGYFRDLELFVDESVLIPRPETEELVQLALGSLQNISRVIDLGTGSGCIALSLKSEIPEISVSAIDYSQEALEVAKKNSAELDLSISFHYLSMTESLSSLGKFDLLISNPPYIAIEEHKTLEENVVAHEPHMALFSTNSDPLHFYRAIQERAEELLECNGVVFLELHENYAEQTAGLFHSDSYKHVEILLDLQGKQRFLKAVKL